MRAIGITRAMGSSDVVLVEIIEQTGDVERVVLIIECRVKDEDARNSLVQLTGYMRDTECTDGILMSANICLIYRDNLHAQLPGQIGRELNLNSDDDMLHLINHINSL